MEIDEVLNLLVDLADTYIIDRPYIVGGLPRDVYLEKSNIKTTDIDITTNSSEVMRLGILLAEEANVTFELSDDGHVTVFTAKFDVDFSSHFVSEAVVKHLNGKNKGLEEAFSRDFTINTLHQDLETREVIDPTGMGFKDIEDKVIRTPVPPEITLTDDPRRIYRAVNLSARYGYEIDDSIVEFVLKNNSLFGSENVKDKYISQKIGKALLENEEFTLKALKKLDLFKYIPLTGKFKEVLIERKMLADYLESSAFDKFAQETEQPASWSNYSSQSGIHSELADWWVNNHKKVPGSWSPDYQSWVRWYMDHYREDWGYRHRSPEDTIEIMEQEASGIVPEKVVAPPTSMTPAKKSKEVDQDRMPRRARKYLAMPGGRVFVKPGVNVDNVTPAVRGFITELGNVAKELGAQIPIITSGWRSIENQSRIMAKNWKNNGGRRTGRAYLEKLYGKRYGGDMATVFENYGMSPEGIAKGVEVINRQPVGSHHIADPGRAVDISLTDGIKEVLDTIKSRGAFDIKIVDETNTAGPHYHVGVRGQTSRASRRADLLKLANITDN